MADRKWKEVVVDTDSDVWDVREAKDGDHIEGQLIKVENDIGPKKSKLYTFKTEKGEVKVWGSTVLNDRLMGVPTDTYVKVEYTGKARSKTGNDYHTYKVFIDEDSVPEEPPKDEVVPMPTDEDAPIDLQDIPF